MLEGALGERADGNWSSFEVGLCIARQNGKSAILEARILAGLFLFREPLIIYSAHEFNTAMETLRRLETLLLSSDEYQRVKVTHSNGKEGIEVTHRDPNGVEPDVICRALFKTRTKSGGRGLSGDCVLLDEAMILSYESIGALMPTLSARPNPQLWYAGSAVDQQVHANGFVFASVRDRGIDGTDPRLAYFEWSGDPNGDLDSNREALRANPGVGYRITLEHIEAERRSLKHSPKTFHVERLGIGDWPTLAIESDPLISEEAWRAMADPTPRLRGPRVIALDRSPDRDTWMLAGAQRCDSGNVHIEVAPMSAKTLTDVVAYVVSTAALVNPAALVIDSRSPAAVLKPYLIEAGIEPVMTSTAELSLACGGFLDAALTGQLSHSAQPILTDSVMTSRRRDFPAGGFSWEKNAAATGLMSATLAHWGLLTFGLNTKETPAGPVVDSVTRDDTADHYDHAHDELDAFAAF